MEWVSIGPLLDMLRISLRGIKHFEAKKRPLQEVCFEIQYTSPNPKFNKWKESQLEPSFPRWADQPSPGAPKIWQASPFQIWQFYTFWRITYNRNTCIKRKTILGIIAFSKKPRTNQIAGLSHHLSTVFMAGLSTEFVKIRRMFFKVFRNKSAICIDCA